MEFNLKFIPDENYYKEAYDEMVSSMKYKKVCAIFCISFNFCWYCFLFFR